MLSNSREDKTEHPRILQFQICISNRRKELSEVFVPILREVCAFVPSEGCDLRASSLLAECKAKLVLSED